MGLKGPCCSLCVCPQKNCWTTVCTERHRTQNLQPTVVIFLLKESAQCFCFNWTARLRQSTWWNSTVIAMVLRFSCDVRKRDLFLRCTLWFSTFGITCRHKKERLEILISEWQATFLNVSSRFVICAKKNNNAGTEWKKNAPQCFSNCVELKLETERQSAEGFGCGTNSYKWSPSMSRRHWDIWLLRCFDPHRLSINQLKDRFRGTVTVCQPSSSESELCRVNLSTQNVAVITWLSTVSWILYLYFLWKFSLRRSKWNFHSAFLIITPPEWKIRRMYLRLTEKRGCFIVLDAQDNLTEQKCISSKSGENDGCTWAEELTTPKSQIIIVNSWFHVKYLLCCVHLDKRSTTDKAKQMFSGLCLNIWEMWVHADTNIKHHSAGSLNPSFQ